MQRLKNAVRLWHVALVLLIAISIGWAPDVTSYWVALAMPLALALIGFIVSVVVEREGTSIRKRGETRHGNDMHGHYR